MYVGKLVHSHIFYNKFACYRSMTSRWAFMGFSGYEQHSIHGWQVKLRHTKKKDNKKIQ